MKVLFDSFHLNGHTLGFHLLTKKMNHLVLDNKQYHIKVLLSNFHLNGHTHSSLIETLEFRTMLYN